VSAWEAINGYTVGITLSVLGIVALDPGSLVAEAYTDGTASIEVFGFTAIVGNASVAVLPAGPVTLTGLLQTTLYYIYYIDPNFAGGAITPIATTNSSDFLNKPGYFLIDSITTPYCSSTGTGARYAPSNYQDSGTRTTSSPTYAYDGNVATAAVVSGYFNYVAPITGTGGEQPIKGGSTSTFSSGNCLWEDFPSYVTTASMSLYITIACGIVAPATISVTGYIGSTATAIASYTTTAAETTMTMAIPTGTDLSTVSVAVSAIPLGSGTASASAYASVYEIYIQ
jgi:hypothetical protein